MKHIWKVLLALLAVLAFPVTALAASSGWSVAYTEDGAMVDNFDPVKVAHDIEDSMQPGDTAVFRVDLGQEYAQDTRWYFSNKVLKTLEDMSGSGSLYGYKLVYTGPSGSLTLFESDRVGGDGNNGLKDATETLQEWLYLDTLKQGDHGVVTLEVTMDGDTEANEYFDTEALLYMRFAVEPETKHQNEATPKKVTPRRIVRTGDNANLLPFYVAMVISGVLLLGLAVYGAVLRKQEQGEDVQ